MMKLLPLVLFLGVARQDEKTTISVEVRLLRTTDDLRSWNDKDAKPYSPWDGIETAAADAKDEGIDSLVRKLDSEVLEERDAASGSLVELGVKALPCLKRRLEGASREVAGRLTTVALKLRPRPEIAVKVVPLAAAQWDEFTKAIAKRKDVTFLSAPTLACLPGQAGSILVAEQISYVQDMELQVDEKGSRAEPVVGIATVGQRIGFTPEATVERITLKEFEIVLSGMRPGGIRKVETPIGAIQDPGIQTLTYRIAASMKPGDAVIAGPLRMPWSSSEDSRLWVVVRAR